MFEYRIDSNCDRHTVDISIDEHLHQMVNRIFGKQAKLFQMHVFFYSDKTKFGQVEIFVEASFYLFRHVLLKKKMFIDLRNVYFI